MGRSKRKDMIEKRNTDKMEEISTKDKDEEIENEEIATKDKLIQTHHVVYHCRTKLYSKTINFSWSIADFWNTFQLYDTLTSNKIEEQFKIKIAYDKEKDILKFFICVTDNEPNNTINIQTCRIYIQGTESTDPLLLISQNEFKSTVESLYNLPVETLRLHEWMYFSGDTLLFNFTFVLCENILHNIIYENISEALITNHSPYYDKSDSKNVTFMIEGRDLTVKKSLLLNANSNVINSMLNDTDNIKIEIPGISYYIFRLVMSFLKCHTFLELNEDNLCGSYTDTLYDLLNAADKLEIKELKIFTEMRLIRYTFKRNVVQHLKIAIRASTTRLQSFAKKYIKLHLDDIKDTIEFKKMMKECPKMLSQILKEELISENAQVNE